MKSKGGWHTSMIRWCVTGNKHGGVQLGWIFVVRSKTTNILNTSFFVMLQYRRKLIQLQSNQVMHNSWHNRHWPTEVGKCTFCWRSKKSPTIKLQLQHDTTIKQINLNEISRELRLYLLFRAGSGLAKGWSKDPNLAAARRPEILQFLGAQHSPPPTDH